MNKTSIEFKCPKSEKNFTVEYSEAERLGKGSYGSVYKARNPQTGEVSVIKYMHETIARRQKRIRNEATLQQIIRSPHTVQCFGYREKSHDFWLNLELCNGGELQQYVDRRPNGTVSEAEAILIIKQIVAGLDAMKQLDVVHRDLKLENVLIHYPNLPEDT